MIRENELKTCVAVSPSRLLVNEEYTLVKVSLFIQIWWKSLRGN